MEFNQFLKTSVKNYATLTNKQQERRASLWGALVIPFLGKLAEVGTRTKPFIVGTWKYKRVTDCTANAGS